MMSDVYVEWLGKWPWKHPCSTGLEIMSKHAVEIISNLDSVSLTVNEKNGPSFRYDCSNLGMSIGVGHVLDMCWFQLRIFHDNDPIESTFS